MSDVASEVDLGIRYVVFIPSEGTKMRLFGVSVESTVEAIEAQISEISEKSGGSVAYYVGDAGDEKQKVANAAKEAGLTYIAPDKIAYIRGFLEKYADSAPMSEILAHYKRVMSRKGTPDFNRWAAPTFAELRALEDGVEVHTFATFENLS